MVKRPPLMCILFIPINMYNFVNVFHSSFLFSKALEPPVAIFILVIVCMGSMFAPKLIHLFIDVIHPRLDDAISKNKVLKRLCIGYLAMKRLFYEQEDEKLWQKAEAVAEGPSSSAATPIPTVTLTHSHQLHKLLQMRVVLSLVLKKINLIYTVVAQILSTSLAFTSLLIMLKSGTAK